MPGRNARAPSAGYAVTVTTPSPPAHPPVHLECVSWHLVQHHLGHGALRFEPEVLDHLRCLPATDASLHFCLATFADSPIDVVGMLQYRLAANDLHFEYIRVRESCRRHGIGRHLLTEVVTHPTCIHLARLHWMAETAGCEPLVQHLEWLRNNVRRRCGTRFRLIVHRRNDTVATPG